MNATDIVIDVRVADAHVQAFLGAPKASAHDFRHVSNTRHPVVPIGSGYGRTEKKGEPVEVAPGGRAMTLPHGEEMPPENWKGPSQPDRQADLLYRSESERLIRFFARRFAREDARDMMHEVFRRFLGRPTDRADTVEQPEAYLTRVADNLARDRARSLPERTAGRHIAFDDDIVAGPDPLAHLESRDAIARVDGALLSLKPKTREIFVLHRVDGLSYAQIAAAKGMSVGGVEKQIAKALTRLRRQLRDR